MLDSLKSTVRRLGAGWYLPLVLLALPDCGLSTDVPPDDGFEHQFSAPLAGLNSQRL